MPTIPTISTSMRRHPLLDWLDLELRRNRVDQLLRQPLKVSSGGNWFRGDAAGLNRRKSQ